MARSSDQWDLFVMHSYDDREWVETYLASALEAADVTFQLQSRLPAGQPLAVALDDAIASSRLQALVVSAATSGDYTARLQAALTTSRELEAGDWSLIPLVLDDAAFEQLRLLVRMRNPIRLAADPEGGVRLLVDHLGKVLPEPPPVPKHRYLGLRGYEVEDAELFFGRSTETAELGRRIARRPLNVVTGPSGSGKSSLVRAGVIPRMAQLDPDGRRWEARIAEAGTDPLRNIAEALDGPREPGPGSLADAATELLAGGSEALLVFVDQVEQALAPHSAARDLAAAVDALIDIDGVHLVLAVRDEFRDDLVAVVGDRAARSEYPLPALDDAGLKEAITGPAREVDVTVAAALVERLVADARGEPGILPFVQETMIALWPGVRRGYLPYQAYGQLVAESARADGATGLHAALANHADDVLSALDADGVQVASILLRLVQFGEGRPHVRRQQTLAQLVAGPPEQELARARLVEELAGEDSRLLTTGYRRTAADGKGGSRDPTRVTVDLAHDSLLTHWPYLRDLAGDEDRVGAERLRREAERDATGYLAGDRSYLWRGRRLQQARAWRRDHPGDVSPAIAEFLRVSLRWYVGTRAVAVVAALLLVAVGVSYVEAWWDERGAKAEARGDGLLTPLDGFAFERYEVTNARYQECVREGPCDEPGLGPGGAAYDDPDRAELPVVAVRATGAAAFCAWIGRRLPTFGEWTHAATGGGARPWPWAGDDPPDPERVNIVFATATGPPPDITPEVEDAIDGLIGRPAVTADDIAVVAPWVPAAERELLAADWPFMGQEERGDRLVQFLEPSGGATPGDLVAVDAFPGGATPDEPPIHHLIGNAGEWTSTLAACEGAGEQCAWDGAGRVALATAPSYEGDVETPFEALGQLSDEARETTGFRCAKGGNQ